MGNMFYDVSSWFISVPAPELEDADPGGSVYRLEFLSHAPIEIELTLK